MGFYATCCELVDEPPGLKPDNLFESVEQLHAQNSAVADADGMEVEASQTSKQVDVPTIAEAGTAALAEKKEWHCPSCSTCRSRSR